MTVKTNMLTAAKVRAINEPGRYADGGTLYLLVAPGGSKSWVQRLTINGRRRDIGLGSCQLITLADARRKALENRLLVFNGGDPTAEKRKANIPTFQEAALKVHADLLPNWKNKAHGKQWIRTLETYAFPKLGSLPTDRVTPADVLGCILPIWNTKAETAKRVRQRIRQVMGWAVAHGYAPVNTAGEAIDGALPKIRRKVEHHRALPYSEVAEALAVADSSRASDAVKLAFRFLVLTAARTTEVRLAAWTEIDFERRLWTIPAERMKAAKDHRQPLSDAALAVLNEAKRLENRSGLIFPSPQSGKELSNMAITKLLRDTGLAERATTHGFRASFRTWADEETSADYAAKELSLAHTVGNAVVQAYARGDLLAKRRRLMQQWANYLTGAAANVVELHAA